MAPTPPPQGPRGGGVGQAGERSSTRSLLLRLASNVILPTIAFGVYVRFQKDGLQPQLQSLSNFLQGVASPSPVTATYCYESIWGTENGADCFTVDEAKGGFIKVFNSGEQQEPVTTENVPLEIKKGQYVVPGLWDGHGHLLLYGEFLHSADLFGSPSKEDLKNRLKGYLNKRKGEEVGTKESWARGVGWDQGFLREGMPVAAWLEEDEELKGKYFMLDRVDVHCTFVSQAILDLIPPENLPDEIPGGEIVRSPGMGVFCDNAMDIVMSLWPKPSRDTKKKFVASAMKELNKVGLVGMHDAGVLPKDIDMFEEMALSERDKWTVRVYAMIECPERNTFCPDIARKVETPNGFLKVKSVKLFADGALGSWGSAMIEPYSDRPDTSGSLLVNASTLTYLAKAWAGAGFQVNIHAIGDLANRFAIDAMEEALKAKGAERFRIEHAQIIHPDDQKRMRELGIIPSIQPTHATSDMAYAEARLGEKRINTEAYRMRSIWDLGPILGSDFPVEPPNPLEGMYAAITRKNPHTGIGPPGHEKGWYVEETLSFEQALRGFTRAPARGAFWHHKAGEIREGGFADWVVFDEDITKVGVEELRSLKVRETWVAGKRVYSRDEEEAKGREDL
ncbi:putative metal dependent amidohydrolase [Podospora australis]|uniref:Metal dependent amidohydrolase n=1 Tax=Podospora australis TaxID=1536484 RepID=A0AAN6X1D7_9PEZI|nr:putative metal dependent amidohydrolase [Podospora australis]